MNQRGEEDTVASKRFCVNLGAIFYSFQAEIPPLCHSDGLKVVPEVNYPVSDDLMLLIVAKNRNGRAGTVYLSHNDSMTRFGDYEPPADWLLEQDAQPVEEKPSRSWRGKQSTYKAFKQKKKEDNGGRLPF